MQVVLAILALLLQGYNNSREEVITTGYTAVSCIVMLVDSLAILSHVVQPGERVIVTGVFCVELFSCIIMLMHSLAILAFIFSFLKNNQQLGKR